MRSPGRNYSASRMVEWLEHALETLHSAVPSASTIYISLHDEIQLENIETTLKEIAERTAAEAEPTEHDHHHHAFPELKPIFDQQGEDIGPAGGLLAAHSINLEAKWLVLACDYPLLPPSGLQQLILEYQAPVTCFKNESGSADPLIAIWGPEALEGLKERVHNETSDLDGIVEAMKGKSVNPLREQWITRAQTREEWDAAMGVLAWRGP